MAILPILCYPDPRLHKVAKPVAQVDERIQTLVKDMLETMYDAQGIGLARTEHMFMAADRLPAVRKMILAENEDQRAAALAEILPMQQVDFEGIFTAMKGLPVTVRLLDPPLHEFLPHDDVNQREMAIEMGLIVGGQYFRVFDVAGNEAVGSNTKALGRLIYTDYAYPVELASAILLLALVAAITAV